MMIIGLHGKAGAGKDTLADTLVSLLEEGSVIKVAFADALKEVVKVKFDLTDWHVNTQEGKASQIEGQEISVREALELEGTEATRHIYGLEFWLWRLSKRIEQAYKVGCEVVIVTDIRFDNEAEFVTRYGGVVIEVVRPNQKEIATITHASAKRIPEELIDIQFINDGTVEDLPLKISQMLDSILELKDKQSETTE